MTKTASKPTFGPDLLDVRVRERFLTNGLLDAKTLEKHLAELPDSEAKGEEIGLEQPALFGVDEEEELDEEDEAS
jgi:hypothetical protein